MDLISILATVILATTIATVLIGIAAYTAFKLRDKRRPKAKTAANPTGTAAVQESIFLTRYVPPGAAEPKAEAAV